jgi:hypothetical protein
LCEQPALDAGYMAALTALRVYDNSADADPAAGIAPHPELVLHVERADIVGPPDLSATPDWAEPIVAAAIENRLSRRRRLS